MATQFVPCRDVEHAVECLEAGILWINRIPVGSTPVWAWCQDREQQYLTPSIIRNRYTRPLTWPATDFALLVED